MMLKGGYRPMKKFEKNSVALPYKEGDAILNGPRGKRKRQDAACHAA